MKISRNLLILVLVTFVLYFPSLFNGFVWDDEELIVNNLQIASPSFIQNAFGGAVFNNGGSSFANNYYRPLMITVFGLITHLFGKTAFWFHLFQLGIHILNVCLLYFIFKKRLLPPLIFALHPLNVESVVYIAALSDTLSLCFILLTLLAIQKLKPLAVLFILTLFALLSKETGAIVLPLGLLLNFKRYLVPAILAVVGYLILRFPIGNTSFGAGGIFPMQNTDIVTRLLTIPNELFYYLSNFIFPHNLTISQHWLVKSPTFFDFWLPIFTIIVTAIIIKKDLFYLLFLSSIILVLNIFPLDATVAPRWFYVPMVGLLGLFNFERFNKLVFIWILFLGVLTFKRELDWRNPLALYSADITKNEESFDLQNNLGTELYRAGRWQEAKIHFENSTKLNPKWWVNWNNLCVTVEQEGEYEKARSYCQKSIDNGFYYLAYENMARLLYTKFSKEEGRAFAQEALKLLPNDLMLQQIASN